MTLQTTNRVAHAKVRETTFGVTPISPAFQALRVTSSGLAASPQTVVSEEIRSDRQVTDLILVGEQAQGPIGGELSFAAADLDIEEAFQGTWTNKPSITVVTSDTEISDVSTTTITVASGGSSFKTGMLVLARGFTTAANNKKATVSSSTSTTVVFPASTFAVESVAIPVGASIRQIGFQGGSGDITATATGLGSTTLDFTTLNLVVGEWIKIGGAATIEKFATAACIGLARISAISAHAITCDILPTGWTTDSGTGKTISVFAGDYVRNGSTQRSATIERQYLDHSPVTYEYLNGMNVNKLSLTLDAQKIVTYSTDYMGTQGVTTTTRVSGSTDVSATSNDVLNTSSNIGTLMFNGVPVASPNYMMSASVMVNNNLRFQTAVGYLGAVGIGNGQFDVTGTFDFYFGDRTIYNAVLNNTALSASFCVQQASGDLSAILFDIPKLKLTSGAPSVTGKNQDVKISAGYQAIRHPTLGYTIHASRYWYLE